MKHDIWHIHGSVSKRKDHNKQTRSLISFIDYANAMNYARKLGDPNKANSKIHKTWLDIFLNSPLIIAGLGLTSQEILLRRLLVARKYFAKSNHELQLPQSFYLHTAKDMGHGKQFRGISEFLDFVGIKTVCFDDYSQIYDFPLGVKSL